MTQDVAPFARLGLPTKLVAVLDRAGITEPFPIQAAVIPPALEGRDICGRAPTGSGKTLAFGAPMITRLAQHDGPLRGPDQRRRARGLVLAPTRELAEQIARDLEPLARPSRLAVTAIFGGVSYGSQRNRLRAGIDVIVACPGRLEDLIQQGALTLDCIEVVVIDEVDRMADMGFLPAVRRIVGMTRADRQTMLFSATLGQPVDALSRAIQRNPMRHLIGEESVELDNSQHLFWRVERADRPRHTAEVIAAVGPTVVFCRTRRGADRVLAQLGQLGVSAAAIHGGRSQAQRRSALRSFASGSVSSLVATDVAARGIHVDGVAAVVHFDPPEDAAAYVHRSGRTARAGATGLVVSLVDRAETAAAKRLQRAVGLASSIESPNPKSLHMQPTRSPVNRRHA